MPPSNKGISFVVLSLLFLLNLVPLRAEIDSFLQNKPKNEKLKILQDTIEYSNNNQRIIECAVRYNEIVKSDKNTKLPLTALYNLGKAYWKNTDYNHSITYFYQALEVARDSSDTLKQINASIYLGLIYSRLNDWEMVQRYYLNAYTISHLYNHYYYTASSCWNMALLCNNTNKYNEALKYEQEALFNLQRAVFPSEFLQHFGYGLVYYYLSDTYGYLKQADSSLFYGRLALVEHTKINNRDMIASSHNNIALALILSKRYDEALLSVQTLFDIANELHNLDKKSWACLRFSECYEGKKMYDSAFKYITLYVLFKDSLNQLDTRLLSSKLELQSKEKVFSKEKELSDQKYSFTVIISVVIVVSLFLISILLYSRYRLKSKLHRQVVELNTTKNKFFTIISHDLKTPIASFNNLSEFLSDYYDDLTELEKVKHLKSLKDSSANIMILLDNLLTWSRLQTERMTACPENLHVLRLVESEIQTLKHVAEKKCISIETAIQPEVYVFADNDMIRTVVRNLLSNAIKFTPDSGRITISASDYQEFIKFDVIDTGIGINKDDYTKLFAVDKKHSTLGTANERGSGLGLNLCKEFIERNHGKLWFESEVGNGSTFSFTLPKMEVPFDYAQGTL